ncbi:ABC transporter substrate-binding protein [Patiriisocius hiemis]|uniref:ABC transporter substrate-binding protein n=1 Tax=Patiriisocius hiemis TaxID=3075604 RepID=A0ABU2Y8B1_9FLAO|nr:ABC transporter substrate-binding protein [Constantimarinum sp. W242]MDT0554419.1 ABC transporter substrate-binding protein [Constantimarinum sp. W242]
MHKCILPFLIFTLLTACKQEKKEITVTGSLPATIKYAEGFSVEKNNNLTIIHITNPWPGADNTYTYALVEKGTDIKKLDGIDAIVETPIENIVVTSTTHIPSLEMLGETNSLIGFPNLNYISSEKTRQAINTGNIKELGKNEDINTEVLIDLSPDAVVGFAVDGNNTTFATIQKTGIPVLYNADWTETHPLGKAEWIKFFGALYGKQKEADSIFNTIEANYLSAKKIAAQATKTPTVLSGAMYKDVWYLPQGGSWAAQFIADANGRYLWSDSGGTGSISANLETVLEKGKEAQYWIGPGQFTSLEQLAETHTVYTQFDAFKNKNVYSFTNKKGGTGGVLYYELAPNRPDIVLKDIIKILHPDLLPGHSLYFFSTLE